MNARSTGMTKALVVGLVLVGFQPACEMPNANTSGVDANGRGIGTPPPLSRASSANLGLPPPPPPPPPPPAAPRSWRETPGGWDPNPPQLKDNPCLKGVELHVANGGKQDVFDMKQKVEESLLRDWRVWIGNHDDLTDVRPQIARTKENADRIRCLQADRPGSDGEAIGHGIDVNKDRVESWASRVEELLADELKCRASPECMAKRVIDGTAAAICPIIADRNEALRQIAAERANPAGVVNLATLHDLGERVQIDNGYIAKLKAEYARAAKKPFNEGSCPR